jgi:hypothetical protein
VNNLSLVTCGEIPDSGGHFLSDENLRSWRCP